MFSNAFAKNGKEILLEGVQDRLVSPAQARLVGRIRQIYNRELVFTGNVKRAKDAVEGLKKGLECVTFSGVFRKRKELIRHSGLICGDLDGLGKEELDRVRDKLRGCPYVLGYFRSPTGWGLKVIFPVRCGEKGEGHMAGWWSIRRLVLELTGLLIDRACQDVTRLCFLSYDPECWFNFGAIELVPTEEDGAQKDEGNGNGKHHPSAESWSGADRSGWVPVSEGGIWESVKDYSCVPGHCAHNTLLLVAGRIFWEWGLLGVAEEEAVGWRVLRRFNRERCFADDDEAIYEEWTECELEHKVSEVRRKGMTVAFGVMRGGIPKPGFQKLDEDEPAEETKKETKKETKEEEAEGEESGKVTYKSRPVESIAYTEEEIVAGTLFSSGDRFLYRKAGCIVSGPAGAGKTTLVMTACLHWAAGREFLGVRPNGKLRTVFLQMEGDRQDVFLNYRKILAGMRLREGDAYVDEIVEEGLGNFLILVVGRRERFVEVMRREVMGVRPELVVCDPLIGMYSGDLNSSQEVAEFLYREIDPVLEEGGCGGLIVHHTGKLKPSTRGERELTEFEGVYLGTGSQVLGGWPRSTLGFVEAGPRGLFKLHAGKRWPGWIDGDGPAMWVYIQRSLEPGTAYWTMIDRDEGLKRVEAWRESGQGTYRAQRSRPGKEFKFPDDLFERIFVEEAGTPMRKVDICRAIEKERGENVNRVTIDRRLERLMEQGKIVQKDNKFVWVKESGVDDL